MPLVTLQIQTGWSSSEKRQLLEAVHAALMEGLKIPAGDQQLRIEEYAPENLLLYNKSSKYVVIHIALFQGRTLETKKRLYQSVNNKLYAIGLKADDIFIVLHEIPMENWGIKGGIPASEVKFDYSIKI